MVDQSTVLPSVSLWCGSYTSPNGTGAGISALDAPEHGAAPDAVAVQAAATTDSPSFLAEHPTLPLLYAVAEFDGTVQAFRRTGDAALEPVGSPWPAGTAACHVFVDPAGRFLIVACWGDGAVLYYELDAEGLIVSRQSAAPAADPYAAIDLTPDLTADPTLAPDAARPSRAHATALLPDGRILTTDLGHDLLRVWRVEPGTGLVLDQELPLGKGSGPRHIAVHPSGHVYIVTEYSIEVLVIGQNPRGLLEVIDRIPATAAVALSTDAAAEISLNEAGTRVYVTVRGSNRLSTFDVQAGGARLALLGDVDCGGNWPRHHLQYGDWLFVANQLSNDVSVFALDADSGLPSEPLGSIPVGSPTCLVPRRSL